MPIRMRYEGYDEHGNEIKVYIHDKLLGSDLPDKMSLDLPAYEINFEGDTTKIFDRIKPCHCTISILIEGEEQELLYDDIITSKEGIFYIECIRGTTQEFIGPVLMEFAELPDEYQPYWQITATDGLAMLKDIDMDLESGLLIFIPISYKDHIGWILNKLNHVQEFWDDTDILYVMHTKYRESTHPVSGDTFQLTSVPTYWWETKNKQVLYKSCYEVLNYILTRWNAQIYWRNGAYYIISIDTRVSDTGDLYAFQKNRLNAGTIARPSIINIAQSTTTNQALYKGSFGVIPPLQKVLHKIDADKVDYDLLASADFTHTENDEKLLFYTEGNTNLAIHCIMHFAINPIDSISTELYYRFTIQVRIENDYLNRSSPLVGALIVNPLVGGMTWNSGSGDIEVFFPVKDPEIIGFEAIYNRSFQFKSPDLPGDGYLYLDINYEGVYSYDPDTQIFSFDSDPEVEWQLMELSKMVISDSWEDLASNGDVLDLIGINDLENNVVIEETVGTAEIITDGVRGGIQQLHVSDGTLIGGTLYQTIKSPGNWSYDGDVGSPTTIERLVIEKMISMQSIPVRKWTASLITHEKPISFYDRISYRNNVYACMSLTIRGIGGVSGTWFQLLNNAVPVTIPDPVRKRKEVKTRSQPITPEDIGLPGVTTEKYGIAPYFKEIILDNENTIDVTSWEFPWPTGATDAKWNAYIDFHIVNTKHRYTSGTLTQNTWTKSGNIITLDRNRTGVCSFRAWNWFGIKQTVF